MRDARPRQGLALGVDDRPRTCPTALAGDPHRLRQVLLNLVGNAVKFTDAGSVQVGLAARRDGTLEIRVEDTGIGMTPDELDRVFEDFSQADGSTTRRFGGTGLGLAIVRRLVDAMNGSIDLASVSGGGTVATVRLPLDRLADAAGEDRPAQVIELGSLRGLKVLVADDNATNRKILSLFLARLEVEAQVVADGAAAIVAARGERFDALLLDISMPEIDGAAALRAIRREEAAAGRPRTPAIAVTANALDHQVEFFRRQGFDVHLAKPVQRAALAAALAQTVDLGNMRAAAAG